MIEEDSAGRRDFFVSFTHHDLPWARWLAWQLEDAGYRVVFQEWDFIPGSNFVLEMQRASATADRTLLLLSPDFLQAKWTQPEWAAALTRDPDSSQRRIVPIRIADCQPDGLLAPLVYIDLVGLDEVAARERLLEDLSALRHGRAKPLRPPPPPMVHLPAAIDRPRFATALPPVWNVPHRRNPAFVGREDLLARLAQRLNSGVPEAATQALTGTGGIGKTSIATEYAWRHRDQLDVVWSVRAEDVRSLIGDYAALAAAVGLPAANQADQHQVLLAVHDWLATHDRWLLIVDNAESPDTVTGQPDPLVTVADLLPTTSVGQVLITSRDIGWSEAAELVDVDLPTPAEATQFLLARTGSDDQEAAEQLTKLLGYLPLAMEQAAAYIQQVRCSLTSYVRRLERVPELTIEKGRARNYSATVATTWQVSVSRIRETPGAEALLEACAHLAPESIPRALFDQPLDELPDDAATLTADPFALDEAIGALHRFSLIKASEETLTLHRLLQDALRTRMNPTTAANRSAWVVRLLARAYPKDGCRDPATWPDCERLLPHALEAAAHAERLHAADVTNGELLNRAGGYLFGRGRYREAVDLGQRALALTKHDLGENHPKVGICNHSLGVRLLWAGDLGDAQHHLERALAIKEATFGSDHDQTALTLTHLGAVLRSLGRLSDAQRHLERALAINEAILGANHRETAITLTHLGAVLRDLGRLSDAQRHLERALAINEAILGANHRETAITLTHLGGAVLRDLGRLSDAQRHLERALAIDEATLGSDHYETAFTLTYLGAVLQDQGQLDVAQQHLERALAIDEAALGPDHHETAITLTHLGAILQRRGSKSDGKLHLQRAHRILQGTRGAGHPDVHAVQCYLAMRS